MSRPIPSNWSTWATALAGSGLVHLGALLFVPEAPAPPVIPDWRDSVMITVPEPPPPPPEPRPEPEPEPEPKPKPPPPKPEVVPAEQLVPDTVEEAPPDTPPPDVPAEAPVQGLTKTSFATSGNTGLSLRAGTTLQASASSASLSEPVDRPEAIAWSDAPRRPRCRVPQVVVPDSVITAGVEGEVHVRFDIDATGQINNVRVVRSLAPAADDACIEAWARSRCRPARRGKTPVAVTDMPHTCLFRAVD